MGIDKMPMKLFKKLWTNIAMMREKRVVKLQRLHCLWHTVHEILVPLLPMCIVWFLKLAFAISSKPISWNRHFVWYDNWSKKKALWYDISSRIKWRVLDEILHLCFFFVFFNFYNLFLPIFRQSACCQPYWFGLCKAMVTMTRWNTFVGSDAT